MNGIGTTQWKSSQLMSKRSYEVNIYRDSNFASVDLHSHDFYELYYFIKGEASYIVENGHYSPQSGDMLLISPNNLHRLIIRNPSATYERIVLWINPRYIRRLSTARTDLGLCFRLADEKEAYLVRDTALSEKIRAALESLSICAASSEYGSDVAADAHIQSILLSLGNYYLTPLNAPARAEQNSVVAAAIDYINAHICDNLSLDLLAEKLFVNKYYLSHLFKAETDTPPHRYILKKRLALSKHLLESGLAVTDVFSQCGFSDYTHFFRAFKAEYGMTPKQYYTLIKG